MKLFYLCSINTKMDKRFEIVILEEAMTFLRSLEDKHYKKILYNIGKAQVENDPELFKKLSDDIWEFRTLYQGLKYRFLAFWDKTSATETLVISTHGFIKKRSNVPKQEIQKAVQIRKQYFENKLKNKKK
ncbi:MAG: type II toxin-antitoxin system RelE/ParE family toxin [Agriterribacter sp.]